MRRRRVVTDATKGRVIRDATKGATHVAPFVFEQRIASEEAYGFFFVESILCVVSIFAAVSVVAAGAGAGAIAGVMVSLFTLSDLAHAATASTAAMRARRFM